MIRPAHSERGAALLILLLIGLVVGLSALFSLTGQQQSETTRAAQTADQLVVAKAALVGYAASYREQVEPHDRVWGYLPCPDANNDGAQDTVGPCNGDTNNIIGRLPYRELGLQDLRDHTGECLWYVVSASHKVMNTGSMMNWDLRGNLRIVDAAGKVLADPDDADGGAVAAIIAPGPPLAGQNRAAGNLRCSGDATNGFNNWLEGNTPYLSPAAGTLELRQGDVGSATHNDRIVWITARELAAPISRRSDLLGTMLTDLRTCFNSQTSLPLPATLANRIDNGGTDPKWQMVAAGIDEILAATPFPASCSWNGSAFTADLWASWKDHIRYVVCKNGTACLTVGVGACTGALLFGGRDNSGAPRKNIEKVLNRYFEDPNRASMNSATTNFSGGTIYNPGNPAQDIALCLNPSTPPGGAPITLGGPIAITAKTVDDGALASLAGTTLMLGNQNVDTADALVGALFGCAWIGNPQIFGNGLRAYFRYKIIKKGQGFVFTIVDADRNPTTNMCGAGGRHLGYAGLPGAGVPEVGISGLRYPKIGLEIDTLQQSGYGNDPNRVDLGKNDQNGHHMAILFWGQHDPLDNAHVATTYSYDDNVHDEPSAAQPVPSSSYSNPVNPAAYSDTQIDQEGVIRHVRLEIVRSYNAVAGTGSYTIKAWIDFNVVPPVDGNGTSFSDTTTDYLSAASTSTTITIEDLGGNQAFERFRLGFTNSASTAQEIQITQFEARTK